ncbi:FAD-dependent oxidoreductase [Mesorhizobium sp. ORM8.1]
MAIPPYTAPSRNAYDIVIVGGAVVGSSTAYWLSQALGKDAAILVIERDSSYEFSSTALSTSAIRQQYSNPINVKISQFGIEIIRGSRNEWRHSTRLGWRPISASRNTDIFTAARQKACKRRANGSTCSAASVPTPCSSSPAL